MDTTPPPGVPHGIPLAQWIWRSYARTALVPLLVVELAIVAIYAGAAYFGHRAQVETLESIGRGELSGLTEREARTIDEQLRGIAQLTQVFAGQAARARIEPQHASRVQAERDRLVPHASGALFSDGGPQQPAVFYAATRPRTDADRDTAAAWAGVDPLMVSLTAASPLVRQVYVNTADSLNRIYPPFAVMDAFPATMAIPTYNFYYEADAAHNPKREVVWTDAYLDPAGAGWIVSAIAPVYGGEQLEAVVGIDMTLATVVEQVLDLRTPWGGYGVLIDENGVAIAIPAAAEADWGLTELSKHEYLEAVKQDTFKPESFSLFRNPRLRALGEAMAARPQGEAALRLSTDNLAAWSTVQGTGWRLLVLAPRDALLAPADTIREKNLRGGVVMVAGMLGFYVVFFYVLYRRAQGQARELSAPLLGFDAVAQAIEGGAYDHAAPTSELRELNASAARLVAMGRTMGAQVDALRRAEDRARRAQETAEAADRAKGRFLANMSHEVRTPMNGVLGMLELLLHGPLDEGQRASLLIVRDSAKRLLAMLDDVLDLSAIEAGKLRLRPRAVEAAGLLAEVDGLVRPLAQARGLAFIAQLDPSLPAAVVLDRERFVQIALNLTSNAVKFTTSGSVSVLLRGEPDGEGRVALVLTVADTGVGIAPEQLERIFDAFAQADDSPSRAVDGAGLGLTIARHLCRQLGGELLVQSAPGQGSVFTARVLAGIGPRPAAEAGATPRALRVLAVDDVAINRMILEAFLSRDGHVATVVGSGPEALQCFETEPYDVALVDLGMPGMDGFTLIRGLRALPQGDALQVLVVTAHATASDREQSLLAGADGFLAKPISAESLRVALAALPRTRGRPAVGVASPAAASAPRSQP